MNDLKLHTIAFAKIICFLLLFLWTFKFITYISKPQSIDGQNIAGLYGEEKNSLEMVYIGGSAAFVYWEALRAFEDTGMVSYVYSANTIQAELYKYMIKEILKNQNPKVIVIDARAFQYRDSEQPPTEVAYRNTLTTMPFSINKVDFVEKNINKYIGDDPILYHFDIIKYHTITSDFIVTGDIPALKENIDMISGKFINRKKGFYFVPKILEIEKTNYYTKKINKPSTETTKILDDLLEYLDKIDTKILFVVSPYQEEKDHKEIYNYIEKRVTEKGHAFIDINDLRDEIGLDYKTDFYNVAHVNIFGADKYTKYLENYLVKNYNLKDYRKDDKYKEWYIYLDEWYVEYNNTKEKIEELMNKQNGKLYFK